MFVAAEHQLTPQLRTPGLVGKPPKAFLMGQKSQREFALSQREIIVVPLRDAGGSALVQRNKTITFAFC